MVIGPLARARPTLFREKHMTQTNWAMKNIRPDSTKIEMIGFKSVIPPSPRESLSARDVLAILNTSRPESMAFTARDKEKDSVPKGINQPGWFAALFVIANSPTSVNDVAL